MKIAVTYDEGQVFQHFGRTEAFKIYDVMDGQIVASEIMGTNGVGHEALAQLLMKQDIDALVCGGMGAGAQEALRQAGITVCSGAAGDADEAVRAFIRGELTSQGVNCDHHHEGEHGHHGHHADERGGHGHSGDEYGPQNEDDSYYDDGFEEGCGGDCGGCGGGCGGCGGGCGGPRIILEGPNAGRTCRVHYCGTFNDGTQFDSSYDRGEPLEFVCGAGMMIPGFDRAVVDMEVGEVRNIHLMPEEAYGMPDPDAILTFAVEDLPGAEELSAGDQAYLSDMYGRPIPVRVVSRDEMNIVFDANHEMAGKELNFKIEMIGIE